MKHQILSRALSLTAAAAMSCTAVLGSGGLQCAAARYEQPEQEESVQREEQIQTYDPDALVKVIIKVDGDAVMDNDTAAEMGAEYLETAEAAELTAQCKNVQQSVQNSIRQIYPELEVGFSYSALYNGFSCELPAKLLRKVKELPGVVSVIEADTIQVPQMNRAAALSGLPAYYDMTGCTGEGQVIAVIDSELDITHPMFAPLADDVETALSREEVTDIINSGILNAEVDPDRAYISNKLPYVIDYLDEDFYEGISDPLSYHGTHVSGIAAGNAFTASDDTELSGIAKDAQLIFFAAGQGFYIDFDAAMAGFEDAVKLHADVINMSWGGLNEYFDENPFSEAAAVAENAGIVVCNAAGNDDNGARSYGKTITPEMVTSNMITDKAELGSPILFVASAENNALAEAGMFLFEDQQIIYRPSITWEEEVSYLSQMLEPGDYEYVYCGYGSLDEISANDVAGKLVLVDYPEYEIDLGTIALNAMWNHALGVIMIDKEYTDGWDYVQCDVDLKIALINYAEGQMMREAENKVVTITGENVVREYPTVVSDYTSWGVKNSLDLRPDIMGIGGRVRSADYDSSDSSMSGTSMASPYVAGCAAVIREYLRQQGLELEGAEFSSYVRKLLMNTAIPYEEDGLYVTPRRQGAGLVSLDKAVAAKVLMNGPAGEAKVNLFDNLGTSFSFDITLTNTSSEDVTFTQTDLRLTTDSTRYDKKAGCDILYSQQALNCTTDFNGPVVIGAGQSQTVTVQVNLDAAQCAQISEKFKYGFYVEGFLMLSGAENSADISIPMLGFYGDWAQVPVYKPDEIAFTTLFGDLVRVSGVSIVETYELIDRISERLPEDTYLTMLLQEYATEEEYALIDCGRPETWISPNNDGIADRFYGLSLVDWRFYKMDMELLDADGNLLYKYEDVPITATAGDNMNPHYQYTFDADYDIDLSALDEGDYTLVSKAYINYPGSYEAPQEYRAAIHVDKTAPEVESEITERDDRTILTIRASDNRALQGITVTGNGTGGVVGVYDPETAEEDWDRTMTHFWGEDYKELCTLPFYQHIDVENPDDLPFILRKIGRISDFDESYSMNFFDACAFTESVDGMYQIEYDITDLSTYSVTVLDNAYNFHEIRSLDPDAEALAAETGIWMDGAHGLFENTGDQFIIADFFDGSVTSYAFTAEVDQLTLTSDDDTRTFTVKKRSSECYTLTDNETGEIYTLHVTDIAEHAADFVFHSVNELEELLTADVIAHWGKEPLRTEIMLSSPYSLTLIFVFEERDGFNVAYENVDINIVTGEGHAWYMEILYEDDEPVGWYSPPARRIGLFEETVTEIPAGLYYSQSLGLHFLFNEDGATGSFLYADCSSAKELLLLENEIVPFNYTIDEEGRFTLCYQEEKLTGEFYKTEGQPDIKLCYDRDLDEFGGFLYSQEDVLEFVTDDAEKIAQLHSEEEIDRLAHAYAKAVTGRDYDYYQVYMNKDSIGISMMMLDNSQWMMPDETVGIFSLTLDLFTLKGEDDFCIPVDLMNPPHLSYKARYSILEIETMAISDYAQKTGITPYSSAARLDQNGHVLVKLTSEWYDELAVYDIDPVTGKGFSDSGDKIDLPKTGNNDPGTYQTAAIAFLMFTAGIAFCGISLRRRKACSETAVQIQ